MIPRIAVACIALGAALGCSGFAPQPLPLPPRPVRLAHFSFTPPNEFGWMTKPAGPRGFGAMRDGAGRDDSYGLLAEAVETPRFSTDEEFLDAARGAFTPTPEEAERFTVKSLDLALWPRLGARCVRGVFAGLDRGGNRASGSDREMVLNAVSFICVNPHATSESIMLSLTLRCDEGHEDPALSQKAEEIAATLEFLGGPP